MRPSNFAAGTAMISPGNDARIGEVLAKSGNGEVARLLRGIWGEMKSLNGRVNKVSEGLAETNQRLDEFRTDVREGFARLYRRLDNVLTGVHGK